MKVKKRYSVYSKAYQNGHSYFVLDNETGRLVDDFSTPNGDVTTIFREPRGAMKLAAMLNKNPDMSRPQTEFHKKMDG
jgi:hypothetical protein